MHTYPSLIFASILRCLLLIQIENLAISISNLALKYSVTHTTYTSI